MHMHRCSWLLTLAAVGIPAFSVSGNAETQSGRVSFDWNKVLADSPELADRLAGERKRLESQIEKAGDSTATAQAQLALANWWLAVPTARPATRWLIGAETASDRKTMVEAGEESTRLIEAALATLAEPSTTTPTDEIKKTRSRLEQSADTLASFAAIFKLAELKAAEESTQRAWRKAGSGLAIVRESDDAELAAAAQLWQAFAHTQAGNLERALDTLPDALLKPEHLPYDLMGRLLRCRLLAEADRYSAATALPSRMEAVVKDWVPSQDRNNTRRLIAFVQYHIVRDWIDKLRSSTRPAAVETLEPILAGIDADFSDLKSPSIYYMTTAVPVKVVAPSDNENAAEHD